MTQTTKRATRTDSTRWTKMSQRGTVTAEYAVGVVFACGLAGACLAPALASPPRREVPAMLWRHVREPWW